MTELTLGEFVDSNAAISESFRQIEQPQDPMLQELVALWNARPADGFEIGRDIPSRTFAPFLSHILFWEPVDGGADFELRLCGEALRLRFGDDAVGKRFTDVIGPEVQPYFIDRGKKMLSEDYFACFDMHLLRKEAIEGRRELLFELIVFPVWSRHREARWILNATRYFL